MSFPASEAVLCSLCVLRASVVQTLWAFARLERPRAPAFRNNRKYALPCPRAPRFSNVAPGRTCGKGTLSPRLSEPRSSPRVAAVAADTRRRAASRSARRPLRAPPRPRPRRSLSRRPGSMPSARRRPRDRRRARRLLRAVRQARRGPHGRPRDVLSTRRTRSPRRASRPTDISSSATTPRHLGRPDFDQHGSIGGCPVPRTDGLDTSYYTTSYADRLRRCVENVKRATGSKKVDLALHSMGGLVGGGLTLTGSRSTRRAPRACGASS